MGPATTLLAENSLFKAIGDIFHPIFLVVAKALAAIYGVIPNYAISIALLTIVIMAILTPLTVKSTKGMLKMQALQPEMKKLQQKYKGPENREQLNQEMMRLYKEHNMNPLSSCIPMFLQTPFLIILYDTIKGLTHTTVKNFTHKVAGKSVIYKTVTTASPLYIPKNSKMYEALRAHPGSMNSFGMNFALKPFSHHSSVGAAIPFFVFIVLAVGLQYFQMKQMNGRNPQAAQANPQMQTMQKFMPLLFAYIYFLVPAAVLVYMVVSTIIRILTQDIIFRTGIVQAPATVERTIPASAKSGVKTGTTKTGTGTKALATGTKASGTTKAANNGAASNGTAGNGTKPRTGAAKASGNGNSKSRGAQEVPEDTDGDTDGSTGAKPHPRAKGKRERKAR